MRWSGILGAIVTMFAVSVLAGCDGGGGHHEGALQVTNEAGETIEELYVTPAAAPTWGPDQLAPDTLADGESIILYGLPARLYDVKAVLADDVEVVKESVPVYSGETNVLGLEPVREIRLVNDTGATIEQVYIAPSSAADWGPEQLAPDVLPDGEAFTFTGLPLGTYDIQVFLSDGTTHDEQFDVDLWGSVTTEVVFGSTSAAREAAGPGAGSKAWKKAPAGAGAGAPAPLEKQYKGSEGGAPR